MEVEQESPVVSVLDRLMREKGLTVSRLATRCGVAQPVLYRIISGETIDPKVTTLRRIAAYFDLTVSQLIGETPLPGQSEKTYRPMRLQTAPLFSEESLRQWPSVDPQAPQVGFCDRYRSEQAFALRAWDNSMEPLFSQGTLMIFDAKTKPIDRDFVLIRYQDSYFVRQYFQEDDRQSFRPIHSDFPALVLDNAQKEVLILGSLIQARQDFYPGRRGF